MSGETRKRAGRKAAHIDLKDSEATKTKSVAKNALIKRPQAGGQLAKSEPERVLLPITRKKLLISTGAQSVEVATMLLTHTFSLQPDAGSADETIACAMKTLAEMAPRNTTEGMLAVQMIGVHNATVEFLRRSLLPNQTIVGADADIARATRLMRIFTAQLDAMAKLKGTAGQQKMTVEHVHVHAGGQAIVGPVAQGNANADDEGGAK
jgi:hypothetical protein